MSRKPLMRAMVITIALICCIFIFQNHPNSSKPADRPSGASDQRPGRMGAAASDKISAEKAARLSPRGWTPPAEFSQLAKPAPRFAYRRGKNAQRYYETPASKEVDARLADGQPGVLAGTPDDGRLHLLPEEIDLHTLVARRMVFDPSALESVIAGQTSQIIAPTTGGEVLTLDISAFKTRSEQSHTLFGRVAGEETTSDVQLVYHDGVIHGTVARYEMDQHIEYRILADGHMMVRELDSSSMTEQCGNGEHTEAGKKHACDAGCAHGANAEQLLEEATGQKVEIVPSEEQGEPMGDTPGWTTVDVVVGYDQGARIEDGGYSQIEARIIASVDRMSTAFSNSQVLNAEMNLLGTIEDPDYVFGGTDPGSMSSELGDLNSYTDGDLDTVSDYATQLGADFVAFVLQEADGSAGLAYRPGKASITARDYMTSTRITFAHELGHNLGCDHSWGDSRQDYKSAYGWRIDPDTTAKVRTIMAYDWGWGNRIPYYANPNVVYNGVATGANLGYNVQNEPRADQRYYQNGLNYTNGVFGFDGNNAALAAYNADTIYSGTGGSSYGATYASNRNTRVSNEVLSPVSSTNWTAGSTQNIFFVGGDHTDNATLALYKGGALQSTLASGLNPATDRNYSWSLSPGLSTGSDYMIRVTLNHAEGGSTSFDSDNFTITALPSNTVEVLSPNGGETVITGEAREITWISNVSGNVKVELLKGGSVESVLSANEANDGSYNWIVSGGLVDGTDYRVRVTSVNNASYLDDSDANFEIIQAPTLEDALDTSGIAWTTSGSADWFFQTVTTHDGVDAAESGDIADDQVSSMEATFNQAGTLTFWWKVSSESGWDHLLFYLNDIEQTGSLAKISGEVNWVQKSVSIPAGTTTVRWTYDKDGSVSSGSDCAWVDQVVFTPSVPTYTVSYNGNGSTGGSAPSNQTKTQGVNLTLATNSGNLIKTGFTFAGWNTNSAGTGTDYAAGGTYSTDADVTLYAKWQAVPTYTISYNGNGNTGGSAPSNQTKTQGVALTLATNSGNLVKTSHGFAGWNTNSTGTGTSYAAGGSFNVDANTTLYAVWNASPDTGAGNDQTVNLSAGGSPWSPAEATTQLWLDADDAGTITLNGSAVSQWNDKSGNNRNATQAGGTAQPARTLAGLNGKNVVTFDGGSDFLEMGTGLDFLAGTSHSAFIVAKTTAYGNIYGAANASAGSSSLHVGFRNNTSYRMNYWGNDWYGSFSPEFVVNEANLLNYVWLPGTSKEIFANATSQGTSTNAGNITAMAGGGRIGRTTNHPFFGGDIAEIIMLTGTVSPEDKERFEGYLAHKWGMTDKLPAGHTYETSPPGGAGSTAVADLSSANVTDPEDDATTVTWSVVGSPPAPVVFGNANAVDTTATFTAEGTYTLRLTTNDGYSSSFDDVVITVGPAPTPYEEWTAGTFDKSFTVTDPNSDQDGDQMSNTLEFALGTDPTSPAGGPMAYTAGASITTAGVPIMEGPGGGYKAVFPRRKDHVAAGLTYTAEFSCELGLWTASGAGLSVVTGAGSSGDYEAVSVPFPATVPLQAGGSDAPKFFRVRVSMD